MVGKQEGRRLEVVVLSARGLPTAAAAAAAGFAAMGSEGRRKVQLTLVSSRDPDGEAFGAKVSPWTEPASNSRILRFGRSGLLCSFPLDAAQGAPGLAAGPRFADETRLRVRLMSSMVPTKNSAFKAVAGLLPSAVASGVSHELDELSAQLEAEAQIPLANILSGRVGFAADRALGGWVPLQRIGGELPVQRTGGFEEEPPLSLWMQMYVLPDHEAMRPSLRAQLEEEINKQPASGAKVAVRTAAPGQPGAGARGLSDVASKAVGGSAPRWGPAAGARPVAAAAVPDLIDVSLDDEPAIGFEPIAGTGGGGGGGGDAAGDLLSLGDDSGFLAAAGTTQAAGADATQPAAGAWPGATDALPRLGGAAAAQQQPQPLPGEAPSAFGFIAAASAQPAAASPAPASASSAFGFIAAGSPSASLDLDALYSNPGVATGPPAPVSQARYSALIHLGADGLPLGGCGGATGGAAGAASAATAAQGAALGKSLESLEGDMLAGLSNSLRT